MHYQQSRGFVDLKATARERLGRNCLGRRHLNISVVAETKYTILVSTVMTLLTLVPSLADQLQHLVTQLGSDNRLAKTIAGGSDI
jgi:hypothetical protein